MPALETMELVLMTLWRASWQASIVILLVLVAQTTLRRWLSPAWRSALWFLVVARLLMPFAPSSAWSLFNLTRHLDPHRATTNDSAAAFEAKADWSAGLRHGDVALADALSGVGSPVPVATEVLRHDASPHTASHDLGPGAASTQEAPEASARNSRSSWIPILFWIWLAGVATLGTRILGGAGLLSKRLRTCAPVADRRTHELLEASRRVMGTRRAPVLVETDTVDSPALFGLWRPKLLLPMGLIRRLDEPELRHVFLHELAHLRRHDLLLNWFAAFLQVLHWFNPLVWYGFGRMRTDREFACDALALARGAGVDRAAYGSTILKLVSDLTPTRPVAGLVGISEGKAHLKRRLRNIASHRTPTRWATVAGAMVLFCLTGVTLTDARTNRVNSESSAEAIEAVPAQFEAQERGVSVPLPEPAVAAEAVKRTPGRQRIEAKLQRIVLDEVQFDGLTLPDVLSYLREVVRQLDPDKQGINFLINPQLPTAPQTPAVDPATGQVIPVPQWEPMDMNRVKIQISPALRQVRLGDVLEAITQVADRPISYSIEEYAIVFAPGPLEPGVQLEIRIYKVDPARLLAGMRATRPPGSEDPDRHPQEQVRDYFRDAGISVLPPSQIYFNDRNGVLMVRATDAELALIESTINMLEKAAPQGSAPTPGSDDGASEESGKQRALETRIFRINVEKLIENQRRLGPVDNLTENTPDDDVIVGIRADSEESNDGLLSLPRVFEVDEKSAGGLPGVTSTNLTERGWEVHLALRQFLRAANVSVMPPNRVYFNDRRGILMVCATLRELDRLQQALESLDGPGLRVGLAVRAIELDRIGAAQLRELGLVWFRGPRQAVGILTERQTATILAALEQQLGEALVSVPSVTASHDRWTRVAWRSATGRDIVLDCRPVVKSDGVTIELTGTVQVGGMQSGEATPFVAPESGSGDPQGSTRRAVVWTGQTMIWSGSMPDARSAAADDSDSKGDNLLVFITPTIAEMAVGGLRSFDPDTIPPQGIN